MGYNSPIVYKAKYPLNTGICLLPLENCMSDNNNTLPAEEWRDVVGYEGLYMVSNWGNVMTLLKKTKTISSVRHMSPSPDKDGYLLVNLWKDGRKTSLKVHRLVCAAFIGECPRGYQVNHKDGIKDIITLTT